MKCILLLITMTVLVGCNQRAENLSFKVEHIGALKNFMMKGDLSAKTSLAEFKDVENFDALGAVENLKGEIKLHVR